jgi:ArsR family transcriptional regulator, arsenate/arsenite/antimonite-responsive transcriptional repressor
MSMQKESDQMNDLMNIFKTLSDETRLRIVMLLHFDELCVCEIGGILDVPQPTISKGLSKLRDLNYVTDTRKEKFVYYKMREDNELLQNILTDIASHIEEYPRLQKDYENISTKWKYSNMPTPIDANFLTK